MSTVPHEHCVIPAPSAGAAAAASSAWIAEEVRSGLTANPKTLCPALFYDAEGSRLFEEITRQPEYYLTRTERAIFEAHADEIIALAREGSRISILELGAGTAAKTGVLLAAAVRAQRSVVYQPVDVSATALAEAVHTLEHALPGVEVQPTVGDYTEGYEGLERPDGRRMALYIGSSIGNFEPAMAQRILQQLRAQLRRGDTLLLGTDLRKPVATLLAAYDDAAGVTAAFNRNILHRINRELGANFNPVGFRHEARWNDARSRIEMHLVSDTAQQVSIPGAGLVIDFRAGESIHTENSYKYSPEALQTLLSNAGFRTLRTWADGGARFQVTLASTADD